MWSVFSEGKEEMKRIAHCSFVLSFLHISPLLLRLVMKLWVSYEECLTQNLASTKFLTAHVIIPTSTYIFTYIVSSCHVISKYKQ